MKKPLSRSIKILIGCAVTLIVFSLIVLFCMVVFAIPEPATLIVSFFGTFGGVISASNAILNGIDKRNTGRVELAKIEKGVCENELDNG